MACACAGAATKRAAATAASAEERRGGEARRASRATRTQSARFAGSYITPNSARPTAVGRGNDRGAALGREEALDRREHGRGARDAGAVAMQRAHELDGDGLEPRPARRRVQAPRGVRQVPGRIDVTFGGACAPPLDQEPQRVPVAGPPQPSVGWPGCWSAERVSRRAEAHGATRRTRAPDARDARRRSSRRRDRSCRRRRAASSSRSAGRNSSRYGFARPASSSASTPTSRSMRSR